MHLVGFIIRIYHDARSSECQIYLYEGMSGIGYVKIVLRTSAWNYRYET